MNATLFILGDPPSPGVSVSMSLPDGNILRIEGAPPLVLGTPVKIRQEETLWLGEVRECYPDGRAAIQVVHSLEGLSELSRLSRRFTGRSSTDDKRVPTLS